jgi:hypothetical protein
MVATSTIDNPILAVGDSSSHTLEFELLTSLEVDLRFDVGCANGDVLGYPDGSWRLTSPPHSFGGFELDMRKARFENDVCVGPFDPSLVSSAQSVQLATKLRPQGGGSWDDDAKLDHPITLT